MRGLVAFLLILQVANGLTGQDNYLWTRYTTEDGLSQNTVMSILQDQKGFMWFATWDGLSRFDGYNFTTYKIRPGDNVKQTSSRIDYITEDKFGFIWMLAYGESAVRFDPVKEEFINVPQDLSQEVPFTRIISLPGGSTWLTTKGSGGLRNVPDSLTKQLSSAFFSLKRGTLESKVVNNVMEDDEGNEWVLTDNGLALIQVGGTTARNFFFESIENIFESKQSFYCATELDNEIWFGSIKGRVWRYLKDGGRFVLLDVPTTSNVVSIQELDNSEIFIATSEDGFLIYDLITGSFRHFNRERGLKSNRIVDAYKDRYGDVWIQQGTSVILQYLASLGKVVNHNTVTVSKDGGAGPVYMIHEDINNVLWIHPEGGGVSWYDRSAGILRPFFSSDESLRTFSDRLHSMYSDRQGNLWMCTRIKGLDKFVFQKNSFNLLEPVESPYFLSDNEIRALMEDSKGRLWVATKGARLALYDSNRDLLGFLSLDGILYPDKEFSSSNVYAIVEDSEGVIWIGTKGDGLLKAVPAGSGTRMFSLTQYKHNANDLYSISHDDVYSIHIDNEGRMWIATYGGGLNLVRMDGSGRVSFINHRNLLSGFPISSCFRARTVNSDGLGNVYVGTTNGLVVLDSGFDSPENIRYSHYLYTPGDSTCLSNNDVHDILVTDDEEIFLATFGGGLNKVINDTGSNRLMFKSYTTEDGLPADVLLSVTQDRQGILWVATENGVSRFNPKTASFRNFNKTDFSMVLNFSEGSGGAGSKGDLFFGTNKGVLHFFPDSIAESLFVPPVIFAELRLANKKVTVGQGGVLEKHIDATSELVLKHNQNIISFSFAALDMKYPGAVRYAAFLEGFDSEWKFLDDQRWVNYTNLPHGNYILRVRSTNSDGLWMNNERSLAIRIKPSFWVTPWAYLVYFTLFFSIAGLAVFIMFTIYKLRHNALLEHEISEMKLDFFTNVSHELRTPLTLITAPLEQVLKEDTLTPEVREQLKTVELNGNRMLRLINQILDFVKISHNKMKMTVEYIALGSFISGVMENFRQHANAQQIEFALEDNSNGEKLWADTDKLEKIVFNLLSNAFKYIADGKFVSVRINNYPDFLELVVADDGMGISENRREMLFGRFETAFRTGKMIQPNTGIGLSLVKELVDMHMAEIEVKSGGVKGTLFIIKLRKGLEHFGQDVEIQEGESMAVSEIQIPVNVPIEEVPELFDEEIHGKLKNTILLVEDNADVRKFIRSVFVNTYKIIEAANGVEGKEKAIAYQPDIIISDWMMPLKDGIDLLKEIRSSEETSHIPFIILSAKSNLESSLEGLATGADDYIAKPFSPSYLLARVESLLVRQRKLQLHYQQSGSLGKSKMQVTPDLPDLPDLDLKFLEELKVLMEKNMDNSSLLVDDLVRELGYSRSVFFKKLKVLTGLAPIEYIRDMRLKRAAQLIEDGQYNITQIAYMVGMNDARYFSKCFKKRFGVTPSGYKAEGTEA